VITCLAVIVNLTAFDGTIKEQQIENSFEEAFPDTIVASVVG
jgi:Na+/H+ antiporter NhaB